MAINFDVDKRINSFEAPALGNYFLIPFIIVFTISFVIALILLIPAFKRGGILYTKYEESCEAKVKTECSRNNPKEKDYNDCKDRRLRDECVSRKEKTGIWAPILILFLAPAIIAGIIAGIVYRIVLYYKNPKVFAATVAWQAFR